jgi:glycine/D-amino acid oxidase-like deaminating enzyme
MKVSIVGAGIMGLSTAWALERLGHQVTLFDQGAIPNPLGSSHDSHRAIRYAYGADTGYQRMVGDAYAIWRRLWDDLGETLYVETGTLCLGDAGSAWIHESAASLAAGGHAVERLTRADLARRFPLIAAESVGEAFYLAGGGALLADRIVAALARLLASRGVELRPATPIRAIEPDRGWVTLADGTVVGADAVLVAAGAWARRLVPALAARVTPSRQVVAYLTPPPALAEAWSRAPLVLDIDRDSGFYLLPPVAGTGLKIGDHRFSLTGDPDGDRDAAEAEIAPMLAACRSRLRDGAQFRLDRLKTCFYTVEPDERFIVEPIGLAGWVMSPCSGHGFKFGPLLGSAVAGAIDAGEADDITLWAGGQIR